MTMNECANGGSNGLPPPRASWRFAATTAPVYAPMPTKPAWPIENWPAMPLMTLSESATTTLQAMVRRTVRSGGSGMMRSHPRSSPSTTARSKMARSTFLVRAGIPRVISSLGRSNKPACARR